MRWTGSVVVHALRRHHAMVIARTCMAILRGEAVRHECARPVTRQRSRTGRKNASHRHRETERCSPCRVTSFGDGHGCDDDLYCSSPAPRVSSLGAIFRCEWLFDRLITAYSMPCSHSFFLDLVFHMFFVPTRGVSLILPCFVLFCCSLFIVPCCNRRLQYLYFFHHSRHLFPYSIASCFSYVSFDLG